MTKYVILEIKSKPDGPGIDKGNGAYVHIFFQPSSEDWVKEIYDFVDYYGYEIVEVDQSPLDYIDSDDWSEFNRSKAIESQLTGFPRFGTFNVFD